MVENFVLSQLINNDELNIKYWRTLGKAEVDFILTNNNRIIPVKVKYSYFKKPAITRSFRNFIDEYKPERALVLTKDFWGHIKEGATYILFAPVFYM